MNPPSYPSEPKIPGPHGKIETPDPKERFALELFDILWDQYRNRVPYVLSYESMVHKNGGSFFNDHIAFRTFSLQGPLNGIFSISRLFEALGYRPVGCYFFENQKLNSVHFQHSHPLFPKLFISELKVWELSANSRKIIRKTLSTHRPPLSDETLASLSTLKGTDKNLWSNLLNEVVKQFHELPWELPEKKDVETLHEESQFGAWVLVHGYNVNHFTALINSHENTPLQGIEKTVEALRLEGIPMKESIEGERGSKLRQSATKAVQIEVPALEGGKKSNLTWTYAYFELAERGEILDPNTGKPVRFEGFLGPQATHLFEMTRKS